MLDNRLTKKMVGVYRNKFFNFKLVLNYEKSPERKPGLRYIKCDLAENSLGVQQGVHLSSHRFSQKLSDNRHVRWAVDVNMRKHGRIIIIYYHFT